MVSLLLAPGGLRDSGMFGLAKRVIFDTIYASVT